MSSKVYRIGIVKYTDHASLNRIEAGIRTGLDRLAEQQNITIDYDGLVFDGQADMERMKEIGRILAWEKVDLVISIATPPTVAMKEILEAAEIPMLFRAVSDPISAKVIDSYEHPGRYITGTSDSLDGRELAGVMLKAVPEIRKAGLLYNTEEFSSKVPVQEAKEFLDEHGVEWVEATPHTEDEVPAAVMELIHKGVQAVLTPTDNTIMSAEMQISPLFTSAGIPQFTGSHAFTINGAFMGLGSYYRDSDIRTMSLVENLLIKGKNPNDMPVIRDPHTFAAINNQVCDALGFDKDLLKSRIAELGMNTLFLDSQEEFDEDSDL
ncbi:MAG: ABC transporter substrate-binding protein [Solobacterium sp.]|nr:ABC transporter substrate-binding protein [Solobacterium sp.]MBQ1446703.1 ABC transporter substrate-binding protein [Solobacterium sp.]